MEIKSALPDAPKELAYGPLRKPSPAYDAESAHWGMLDDFFAGGFQLDANKHKYIHALVGEHPDRYQERLKSAGYINYLGQIVNYFKSALFSQPLNVSPAPDSDDDEQPSASLADEDYYESFAKDADLAGNSLAAVLRGAFVTAACKRRAIVAIDFPAPSDITEVVETRADEERLGLGRAYVYEVPLDQVIRWQRDAYGKLNFAVIHSADEFFASPFDAAITVRETFKVWRRVGDVVRWDSYAIEYEAGKEPKESDAVKLVDGGNVTFKEIPLLELELPDGLWIGNQICLLAKEHFAGRSSLNASQNRNLVAVAVVKLGPETTAPGNDLPADVQTNPTRGMSVASSYSRLGYAVIGSGDDLFFRAPPSDVYELKHEQLKDLKDEIFRVVYQMAAAVENTASSVGRSAASKIQDKSAECLVLTAMGELVRKLAVRIYGVISEARDESIVWEAHGLDAYESEDRTGAIDEALKVDLVRIPSKTFKKHYATSLVTRIVPNIEPETLATIKAEIEVGVDHEAEVSDLMKTTTTHDEPDGDETSDAAQ